MRISLILLLATLLVGCNQPADPPLVAATESSSNAAPPPVEMPHYPVLVLDEQHNCEGTNEPETYHFAATPGVQLDASSYAFSFGTNPIAPDILRVCMNSTDLNTNAYGLRYPKLAKVCVVDRKTLDPLRGDLFPGFRTGDRGLLVIGYSGRVTADTKYIKVEWVGRFEVK